MNRCTQLDEILYQHVHEPQPKHAIANCSQTVSPMLPPGEYKRGVGWTCYSGSAFCQIISVVVNVIMHWTVSCISEGSLSTNSLTSDVSGGGCGEHSSLIRVRQQVVDMLQTVIQLPATAPVTDQVYKINSYDMRYM